VTVSANSSLQFQVDEMLVMAYQLCGILEAGRQPDGDDLAMGRNFMNLELQSLQAEAVVLRTIERSSLTLGTPDSGTVATYTLPADTIDVQLGPNDQVGTIVNTSGTESLVMTMARAEYQDISNKTASVTGKPTRAYVEKKADVTVTLWPAPDSSAVSLSYSRVRLLRDADTGSVTIDLARRWMKYVTYATAVHLARAKSVPADDVADLRSEAERQKAVCMADDSQRGHIKFRLAHGGRRW
jgi:hypothetical protein